MFKKRKTYSTFLTVPSITQGISRVVDMFGYLDGYNHFEIASTTSDQKSIRKDWELVGQDLQNSIEIYDSQESCPANKGSTK